MQRYNNMCKILKATALVKRKSAFYFLLLPKNRWYLESLKIKFFICWRAVDNFFEFQPFFRLKNINLHSIYNSD